MRQLGRILLTTTSGSSDEQSAAPDERGNYGGLSDEIDQVLEHLSEEEHGGSDR